MTTHYALLGIPRTAAAEDVKRAFRREVSKYHPDKVQHLGPEFEELATSRSAALMEAYRVLIDAELRRRYDEQLAVRPELKAGHSVVQTGGREPSHPWEADGPARRSFGDDRQVTHLGGAASLELVRRAVLMKIREAAAAQGAAVLAASGFDAAYRLDGRKALFRSPEPSIAALVRIVPGVDGAAVEASWPAARRCQAQADTVCLLLLGSGVASPRDLGGVISGLRRKSRGFSPVVVPVDIRDWQALLPPETPGSIRALLARVRNHH